MNSWTRRTAKSNTRKHPHSSLFLLLAVAAQISCAGRVAAPSAVTLTILHTNDEHGWIEESEFTDGAAKLMGVWRDVEGYREDGPFLILSGGDNWTGPAISTWFEGESTVDVMNAMNYNASTVGNHEFDFKIAGFEERLAQAEFPYVSANIRLKANGDFPRFVVPYVMKEVSGLQVGIVGLTTTSTPRSGFPTYVETLDFIPYADALSEVVPQVWDDGADIVVVVSHICHAEMTALVPLANQLGISVIGGGHCNELVAEINNGVAVIEGGWRMASYARVQITFDGETGSITELVPSTAQNNGGTPDPEVAAVVSRWIEAADAELSDVVGFASSPVGRGPALHNLIADSWLHAYPSADIAMNNAGGVRQGLPAGEITRGTIIGMLPFQNNLLALELTGSQVVASLRRGTIVAGMTTVGGFFHSDGSPMKMDSVYTILTTDYLYAREDYPYAADDPDPILTGINYHQPTIEYLEFLNTTNSNPLNQVLDPAPRR